DDDAELRLVAPSTGMASANPVHGSASPGPSRLHFAVWLRLQLASFGVGEEIESIGERFPNDFNVGGVCDEEVVGGFEVGHFTFHGATRYWSFCCCARRGCYDLRCGVALPMQSAPRSFRPQR